MGLLRPESRRGDFAPGAAKPTPARPLRGWKWGLAALLSLAMLAGLGCGTGDGSQDVPALSLEEAAGQMLMVGFRGDALDAPTMAMLRDVQPGGVVLFDRDGPSGGEVVRNITSPSQLRALTSQLQATASIPYFIAIDAEGGFVNRLKAKYGFAVAVPSAQTLGTQPTANTAAVAGDLAQQLKELGINWNFAPVVDVNIDPESPAIGAFERSFSDEPAVVAAHASAFIEAHQENDVIPTLKHFPGHGSASGDTHLGVTDVTATYQRDAELAPYQELIADGYDDPIMTAHIVNRGLDASGRPGTLSRDIMTGLIRDEMGFGGVIVSDDMQMGAIVEEYGLAEAAVEAIKAGVDMVMVANQAGEYDLQHVYRVRDAIIQAVRDGVITEERIRESADRILALKGRYGIR